MSAEKCIRVMQSRIDKRSNLIAEKELQAGYFAVRALTGSSYSKNKLWEFRGEIKSLAKQQREDKLMLRVLRASLKVARSHAVTLVHLSALFGQEGAIAFTKV